METFVISPVVTAVTDETLHRNADWNVPTEPRNSAYKAEPMFTWSCLKRLSSLLWQRVLIFTYYGVIRRMHSRCIKSSLQQFNWKSLVHQQGELAINRLLLYGENVTFMPPAYFKLYCIPRKYHSFQYKYKSFLGLYKYCSNVGSRLIHCKMYKIIHHEAWNRSKWKPVENNQAMSRGRFTVL